MTVKTPDCPHCGRPPAMQLDPAQAFCGNASCDVLAWNPTQTMSELEASTKVIDMRE